MMASVSDVAEKMGMTGPRMIGMAVCNHGALHATVRINVKSTRLTPKAGGFGP